MTTEQRRHFEASISGMAKTAGLDARRLRDSIKAWLISSGNIKSSTSELAPDELERIAGLLGRLKARTENTPPDERGIMTYDLITNFLK